MSARILVPRTGGHTADWGYDVIVHFHGHEAVRSPFVQAVRGAVLVGIDLGIVSKPYSKAYEDPTTFPRLLARITQGLQKATGNPQSHIRHIAVSSWSAGFGAVTKILKYHLEKVDAVILLDSLHADYAPSGPGKPDTNRSVQGSQLGSVLSMAQRAVHGDGVLFLSHSQIVPPGYASTGEVADYLIEQVSGTRVEEQGINPLGARLATTFDRGGMHVRGYAGGNKAAHCAHVVLLAEAVRDYLEPMWKTPGPPVMGE